jgi:hypothetical protein
VQEDEKYKGIDGKPEGKRSLERLGHTWEDDTKMEHKE